MNQEMNNNNNNKNNNMIGVSVTSLLMKTLENATKEYARECIRRCALKYGFSSEEAEVSLNLENCVIQVKEMKKRSGGKRIGGKALKEGKKKEVKEVKEKAVQIALPFVEAGIKEEGCEGLAYNSGLFTQCQKKRMSESSYCKGCQHEADGSATGEPMIGTVYGRMSVGMMEFRDGKGRRPIAYRKIMEKNGLSRERVEEEALKLNITIDEVHFAAVDENKRSGEKAGRPKTGKKSKVVSAETVEDLFAQLVDEDECEDDSTTSTVLMSDSEGEENEDKALTQEQKARESASEKVLRSVEQGMMKEADAEGKKIVKAEQRSAKAEELMIKAHQKEQKAAEDLMIKAQQKEQKAAEDLAAKEQKAAKLITDKLEKEEKMAAELIVKAQLKEQKAADDLVAKEQKAAKLIEDKELKVAADLAAKEQKAAKLIEDKELKVAADLAAKELKAAKLITDKLEKEEKMAAELIVKAQLKEAKVAADLAAKELKAAKLIEDKELKAAKVAAELVAKEKKAAEPKKVVEKKVAAKKPEAKKAAAKAVEVKKAEVEAPAVSKKVTVKRITINGKEYLKTVDNLLYDPETREEMGTYDAETNTIKALPDDDDDEIEEDGYDTDAN